MRVAVADGTADCEEVRETVMDVVGLAEEVVVRVTVVVRVARGDAVPVTVGASDCEEVSEGEAVVEGLAEEEEVSEAVGERVGGALTL